MSTDMEFLNQFDVDEEEVAVSEDMTFLNQFDVDEEEATFVDKVKENLPTIIRRTGDVLSTGVSFTGPFIGGAIGGALTAPSGPGAVAGVGAGAVGGEFVADALSSGIMGGTEYLASIAEGKKPKEALKDAAVVGATDLTIGVMTPGIIKGVGKIDKALNASGAIKTSLKKIDKTLNISGMSLDALNSFSRLITGRTATTFKDMLDIGIDYGSKFVGKEQAGKLHKAFKRFKKSGDPLLNLIKKSNKLDASNKDIVKQINAIDRKRRVATKKVTKLRNKLGQYKRSDAIKRANDKLIEAKNKVIQFDNKLDPLKKKLKKGKDQLKGIAKTEKEAYQVYVDGIEEFSNFIKKEGGHLPGGGGESVEEMMKKIKKAKSSELVNILSGSKLFVSGLLYQGAGVIGAFLAQNDALQRQFVKTAVKVAENKTGIKYVGKGATKLTSKALIRKTPSLIDDLDDDEEFETLNYITENLSEEEISNISQDIINKEINFELSGDSLIRRKD